MTPERWQELKKVLAGALERPPAERPAYLSQACADPGMRRELESLIAAHEQGDSSFMERSAVVSRILDTGRQLGPYKILGPLGAGGMGEVYQAHDTKLGRDVAIKVLPQAFEHDTDRLSRFQREARMLASLNHPNIATIHGLEQSDGIHYLVMELVAGQTLAERLGRGALGMEEALRIGYQITEALEAAHEKGVIHRDLKPANMKITPEGRVKILDFGLAKAFDGDVGLDLSNAPTLTAIGTKEGIILGTPAYMSPEQARGKPVDKRTDIRAFGCVLYELLTGRRMFRGETLPDTLANLRITKDGTQVDEVYARIPAIGVITGSGTVSPKSDLDFALSVQVIAAQGIGKIGADVLTRLDSAGSGSSGGHRGVPMLVTGTANEPIITADVHGIFDRKKRAFLNRFGK